MIRHPDNPILTSDHLDDSYVLVFNPGVVRFRDRLLMAYRADRGTSGDPNVWASDIRFAWSDDGIQWDPDREAVLDRSAAIELLATLEPHRDLEREVWRIYDPRLTSLEDAGRQRLILTFAADTVSGLRAGIAESEDGRRWTALALGPPDNRNQVLFPERIGGRWARLERPMNHYGGEAMGAGQYGIWLSASPDLIHWGGTRLVCQAGDLPYADHKVGPGPPPIRTEAGWLCIVHVVSSDPAAGKRGWEPNWPSTYRAAAVLLDADDPSRLVAVAPEPLLAPDPRYPYEIDGYRNEVIFPTGAVLVDRADGPVLQLYYGAADTSIALASAPLDTIVEFVMQGSQRNQG